MAELIADCPRCGAKRTTFDVKHSHVVQIAHGWKHITEVHTVCRACQKGTIFFVEQQTSEANVGNLFRDGLHVLKITLNRIGNVSGFVSLKDSHGIDPPKHLPDNINAAFEEATRCLAVGCPNAAAAMFRLCIDLATELMLPNENTDGLNAAIRRSLGLRLEWLFNTGRLPEALRELSAAVKDDGNDGAHEGTLTKDDAEDLLDFATALLERLYTEPERLRLAKERREARKAPKDT